MFLYILIICCFSISANNATLIRITWSESGIPFISVRINNRIELRALDTASSNPLVVYDTDQAQGTVIPAIVDLFPVGFWFDEESIVSNTSTTTLTLPIQQQSVFGNHDEVDWFTITPQGFYPFPREDMRANRGQFCQDQNEGIMLVAGPGVEWNAYQLSGDVVTINSLSPYIRLVNDVYTMFMEEVRDILSATNITLTTNPQTNETLIHDCNVAELDGMLPEIEFGFAVPNPNSRFSWFIHDAIPHYVRISPKDYLFISDEPSRICNLGILPSNDLNNEIGTALFKSHSVSFSARRHSVIICKAPIA